MNKVLITIFLTVVLAGCATFDPVTKHMQTVDLVQKNYQKLHLPHNVNRQEARIIAQRRYAQNKFRYKSYFHSFLPAPEVYLPSEYFNRKYVIRQYGLDQYDIREGFEYRKFPENFIVVFEDFDKDGFNDYVVMVNKSTGNVAASFSCAYTFWMDKFRCEES